LDDAATKGSKNNQSTAMRTPQTAAYSTISTALPDRVFEEIRARGCKSPATDRVFAWCLARRPSWLARGMSRRLSNNRNCSATTLDDDGAANVPKNIAEPFADRPHPMGVRPNTEIKE
jgi:hypothetical protein